MQISDLSFFDIIGQIFLDLLSGRSDPAMVPTSMNRTYSFILFLLLLFPCLESFSQQYLLERTRKATVPDVEQPSLHYSPLVYYKPAKIFLNLHDTVTETVYWRRNFTDQFLETWSDYRMYPASMVFAFIQDSLYHRSTYYDQYHIFVPQICSGPINLYFTRYIHNEGEIRMVSTDAKNPDYHNSMIVTGDVPRRYANEFTFFVTFPWDTLKMIQVTHKSLPKFSETYLRAYPAAYDEAWKISHSDPSKILLCTLIPLAAISAASCLLVPGYAPYFLAISAGMVVTYIAVKVFVKPKELDPEAMIRIIEKCK
jgi:hypothetical protein